jgi:uncharacterized repeat protein (TIGR03803 family)
MKQLAKQTGRNLLPSRQTVLGYKEIPMNRKTGLVAIAIVLMLVGAALTAHAQKFNLLYTLGTNVGDPQFPTWPGVFVQARDGNLYSTTPSGGAYGHGAVFRLTPSGKVTVVYSFTGNVNSGGDGGSPQGGLTLGFDGNLYGIGLNGGLGAGTVFKVTTLGQHSIVHSFNGTTEGAPIAQNAAPIQGKDGNFYGTTRNGSWNAGAFYKMNPSGTVTVLYQFGTNGSTVAYPNAVIQGADGNFYGTCGYASGGNGGVFKITPTGNLTVLHAFNGSDGNAPYGPIIQGSDGNLYGTTRNGDGYGVIYQVTPTGRFKVLYHFASCGILGCNPLAGLVQATDGKLYGADQQGGAGALGTGYCGAGPCPGALFQITSTGSNYTVLYGFPGNPGGAGPQVSLFQHTNGAFYSDTYGGGAAGPGCAGPCGTLYSYDMGLHPFVSLMTTAGKAGQRVQILGQGFTGTTSVSFGSGAASFQVLSDTYMTAVVPATGTTANVTVVTPGGSLVSSKVFSIIPTISGFSPTTGRPGSQVVITGKGLAQTTKVTFGGVASTSFIKSATQVTATVPAGAVTGKIKITTTGGTATSSGTFTVI